MLGAPDGSPVSCAVARQRVVQGSQNVIYLLNLKQSFDKGKLGTIRYDVILLAE